MTDIEGLIRRISEFARLGYNIQKELDLINQQLNSTQKELLETKSELEVLKIKYNISIKENEQLFSQNQLISNIIQQLKEKEINDRHFYNNIFNIDNCWNNIETILTFETVDNVKEILGYHNSTDCSNDQQNEQINEQIECAIIHNNEYSDEQILKAAESLITENMNVSQRTDQQILNFNVTPQISSCDDDINYNGTEEKDKEDSNYSDIISEEKVKSPLNEKNKRLKTCESVKLTTKISLSNESTENLTNYNWVTEMDNNKSILLSNGNEEYVCNICGNVFKGIPLFELHYIKNHKPK